MTDLTPEQLVDLDEVGGGDPATSVTDGLDAVDEQLIARLTGKAREGGMALTGEGGLLAQLTKRLVESALDGELTDHLGYDKHDVTGRDGGNSRNGHRSKTVLTEVGPVEIDVPRDRDGSFEPKIVAKRQRRLSGVDELVISLSAKGLTTGEVQAHLAEVYGAQVSRQTISTITDKVVEGMAEWQNRPLDPVYPVIFIDAIHVKIRDGKVANRPIYVVDPLGRSPSPPRAAATSSGCGPVRPRSAEARPARARRHRTCRSCQAAILVEVGKALASS
jgi:putative transposase